MPPTAKIKSQAGIGMAADCDISKKRFVDIVKGYRVLF
jgi:hypothetical protein